MGSVWKKNFKSRHVIAVGLLMVIVGFILMDSPNERLGRNMGAVSSIGMLLLLIGLANGFFSLFKKRPKEPPTQPTPTK